MCSTMLPPSYDDFIHITTTATFLRLTNLNDFILLACLITVVHHIEYNHHMLKFVLAIPGYR